MNEGLTSVGDDRQALRTVRGRATRRVAIVSAVVNLLLSLAQVLVGLIANSAALVADGVHSVSDLLSDVLVWFAARHAAQAPDSQHPYGHGRFETAATLALGTMLGLVALGIIWNGIARLLHPAHPLPDEIALLVAAGGVLAKESLYWYTIAVARRIKSDLLRANAWHHRSDSISSVIVLIGVGAAVFGFGYMDAVAAIIVGAMVAKIAWDLGFDALAELVDTGLDDDVVAAVTKAILEIEGVRSVHMLRTRRHGPEASADVHVQVAPRLSVSEGHMISQAVAERVTGEMDTITDITVHIDPEDDEDAPPSRGLPLRPAVEADLYAAWDDVVDLPAHRRLQLHYLDGRVDIELVLPLERFTAPGQTAALQQTLVTRARHLEWFAGLKILYESHQNEPKKPDSAP